VTGRTERYLLELSHDPAFEEGARNAVEVCLRLTPGERMVLITDREAEGIGSALALRAVEAGADLRAFVLEDLAERPLTGLPAPVGAALEEADVSIYAAGAQPGELQARIEMTSIVNRRGIRHGHMVNITPRIMREGMRADFRKIDALCQWLLPKVRATEVLRARTPAGTDLRATFDPGIRWIKTSGIISKEKWGNLPGGEVFTAPARVDGTYVVDGVLGDWMASRFGDMGDRPLRVEIEDSRIVHVECDSKEVVDEFLRYTTKDENSDRVGELALGTNVWVKDVIGQILQDEKIPGLHIAFGHPYSEHTGAKWRSTSHIDVVGRHFTVELDGEPVMRDSRFLVDLDALH
jgi:leucyl aminopeptidase (aminopeptidase T)